MTYLSHLPGWMTHEGGPDMTVLYLVVLVLGFVLGVGAGYGVRELISQRRREMVRKRFEGQTLSPPLSPY